MPGPIRKPSSGRSRRPAPYARPQQSLRQTIDELRLELDALSRAVDHVDRSTASAESITTVQQDLNTAVVLLRSSVELVGQLPAASDVIVLSDDEDEGDAEEVGTLTLTDTVVIVEDEDTDEEDEDDDTEWGSEADNWKPPSSDDDDDQPGQAAVVSPEDGYEANSESRWLEYFVNIQTVSPETDMAEIKRIVLRVFAHVGSNWNEDFIPAETEDHEYESMANDTYGMLPVRIANRLLHFIMRELSDSYPPSEDDIDRLIRRAYAELCEMMEEERASAESPVIVIPDSPLSPPPAERGEPSGSGQSAGMEEERASAESPVIVIPDSPLSPPPAERGEPSGSGQSAGPLPYATRIMPIENLHDESMYFIITSNPVGMSSAVLNTIEQTINHIITTERPNTIAGLFGRLIIEVRVMAQSMLMLDPEFMNTADVQAYIEAGRAVANACDTMNILLTEMVDLTIALTNLEDKLSNLPN